MSGNPQDPSYDALEASNQGAAPVRQPEHAKPDPLQELARLIGADPRSVRPPAVNVVALDTPASRIEPTMGEAMAVAPITSQEAMIPDPFQVLPEDQDPPFEEQARILSQLDATLPNQLRGHDAPIDLPPLGSGPAPWRDAGASPLFETRPFSDANAGGTPDPFSQPFEESFQDLNGTRRFSGLAVVASILGVALLGGLVAFFARGTGSISLLGDGRPPVIVADKAPVKIAPENPGGADIPNQNKQIYERANPTAQTNVVVREEQPVDLPKVTRPLSPSLGAPNLNSSPSKPPVDQPVMVDEPKKVRTVAIRPDGSPVETPSAALDQPVAQSAAQASAIVGQPNPSIPIPLEKPATKQQERVSESRSAAAAPKPVAPAVIPAPAAVTKPVDPFNQSNPNFSSGPLPLNPQGAAASRDNAPAAASPVPQASQASSSGGFIVQLSSQRSEAEARAAFSKMSRQYSGLSGLSPNVIPVDLGERGTFYRVRVGPFEQGRANDLCASIKRSGGSCIVQRN